MTGDGPGEMILAALVIYSLWLLLRIASGVETIGAELRRLREIAQGRQQ